jgi:hypothetical protein
VTLFVVAGLVGGIRALLIFLWSPVFLVPRGIGGIVICGIVYLAPGLAIGVYASSLPKLRAMQCRGCGWNEVREVG